MPTGYTTDIYSDKDVSFERFVWDCARAFGPFVLMRDDPIGAPIPERFEPTDYHIKKIAEESDELGRLEAMTPEEIGEAARADHSKRLGYYFQQRDKSAKLKERYGAMLERVRGWEPPTADHAGLKKFMVEQLEMSINCDCYDLASPESHGVQYWFATRQKELRRSLEYHRAEHKKEVERTDERNRWLAALRGSVPVPKELEPAKGGP